VSYWGEAVASEVVGYAAEAAYLEAIAIPVLMFGSNAIARRWFELQQSPATDLIFAFLVFDITIGSDPTLATTIMHIPLPGTRPMLWLMILVVLTFLFWIGLLVKHERPIHAYYAGRGGPNFPAGAWLYGWVLAGSALSVQFYLFPL